MADVVRLRPKVAGKGLAMMGTQVEYHQKMDSPGQVMVRLHPEGSTYPGLFGVVTQVEYILGNGSPVVGLSGAAPPGR